MMKGTYRVALALGMMLTMSTASAEAAVLDRSGEPEAGQIRIVNNHLSPVLVYAEDADGRMHPLGRVARGQVKSFAIPAEVAAVGDFRIKVYPNEPIGSWPGDEKGIKTQPLHVATTEAVTVWLEADLAASTVEIGSA